MPIRVLVIIMEVHIKDDMLDNYSTTAGKKSTKNSEVPIFKGLVSQADLEKSSILGQKYGRYWAPRSKLSF